MYSFFFFFIRNNHLSWSISFSLLFAIFYKKKIWKFLKCNRETRSCGSLTPFLLWKRYCRPAISCLNNSFATQLSRLLVPAFISPITRWDKNVISTTGVKTVEHFACLLSEAIRNKFERLAFLIVPRERSTISVPRSNSEDKVSRTRTLRMKLYRLSSART